MSGRIYVSAGVSATGMHRPDVVYIAGPVYSPRVTNEDHSYADPRADISELGISSHSVIPDPGFRIARTLLFLVLTADATLVAALAHWWPW